MLWPAHILLHLHSPSNSFFCEILCIAAHVSWTFSLKLSYPKQPVCKERWLGWYRREGCMVRTMYMSQEGITFRPSQVHMVLHMVAGVAWPCQRSTNVQLPQFTLNTF